MVVQICISCKKLNKKNIYTDYGEINVEAQNIQIESEKSLKCYWFGILLKKTLL